MTPGIGFPRLSSTAAAAPGTERGRAPLPAPRRCPLAAGCGGGACCLLPTLPPPCLA